MHNVLTDRFFISSKVSQSVTKSRKSNYRQYSDQKDNTQKKHNNKQIKKQTNKTNKQNKAKQTIMYKRQNRKLKIEQHEPYKTNRR
jgi:glycosylphosphatidylinositol transamidase (GPIT) subunit GPI8